MGFGFNKQLAAAGAYVYKDNDPNTESIVWKSGNYIIYLINYDSNDLPQDFINAYLAKYPSDYPD